MTETGTPKTRTQDPQVRNLKALVLKGLGFRGLGFMENPETNPRRL